MPVAVCMWVALTWFLVSLDATNLPFVGDSIRPYLALGLAGLIAWLLGNSYRLWSRARAIPLPWLCGYAGLAALDALLNVAFPSRGFMATDWRAYADWLLNLTVPIGFAALALKLAPVDLPSIGKQAPSPWLRLSLGLAVLVNGSITLLPPHLSNAAAAQALDQLLKHPAGALQQGASAPEWLAWSLPLFASLAYVKLAGVQGRILATQPGLRRLTIGLVSLLLMAQALQHGLVAILGGENASLASVLVVVLAVMVVLPLGLFAKSLLLWGLLRMLLNLGTGESAAVVTSASAASPDDPLPTHANASSPHALSTSPDGELATLRQQAQSKPHDHNTAVKLHQALLAAATAQPGNTTLYHELGLQARQLIALQVRGQQATGSLSVVEAVSRLVPDFAVAPEHTIPLCKAALAAGQAPLAIRLLNGFEKRHPGHADLPSIYFLSAQTLLATQQSDKALRFLQALVARFPSDPMASEAKLMLRKLEPA